ncbi:MAG: hypothetical protein ACFB2X_26720, partial [Rivularia sp. (in: cyanobacteria)]
KFGKTCVLCLTFKRIEDGLFLKARGRITAPMLRWKREVRVVRVKCQTCPYFTEQQIAMGERLIAKLPCGFKFY